MSWFLPIVSANQLEVAKNALPSKLGSFTDPGGNDLANMIDQCGVLGELRSKRKSSSNRMTAVLGSIALTIPL